MLVILFIPRSWAEDSHSSHLVWLNLHLQYTNVSQYHPGFASKTEGANSLHSSSDFKSTNDATLYLGIKLWKGSEFFINPEVDQGFGFSNTLGVAGFPSGEAYKVGKGHPYIKYPRLFLRQTINLNGETNKIEDDVNQFAQNKSNNNIVITLGKFSVVDIFDTNIYAHDARVDFLNWSVIDNGAFDYAADSWGFTQGGAIELSTDNWTYRYGLFAMSKQPNSEQIDTSFHQHEQVAEIEHRYNILNHPGKLKLLGFNNYANMGAYKAAIDLTPNAAPDISQVRKFQSRSGFAINVEQEVSEHIGYFAKFSMNQGSKETFDFTDINRSVATGLNFNGALWSRSKDSFGIAISDNVLSADAKAFFKAGGLGPLIGDGPHYNYGNELIFESFYSSQILPHTTISFDYQHINNPAYNPDRGPVNVYALRLHLNI